MTLSKVRDLHGDIPVKTLRMRSCTANYKVQRHNGIEGRMGEWENEAK
jgi:hypothetical protein